MKTIVIKCLDGKERIFNDSYVDVHGNLFSYNIYRNGMAYGPSQILNPDKKIPKCMNEQMVNEVINALGKTGE